jgi:hydrogenase maturation protease
MTCRTTSRSYRATLSVSQLRSLGGVLQLAAPDIVVYAIEGGCFEAGAVVTPHVGAAAVEAADRIVAEVDALRQASCDQ